MVMGRMAEARAEMAEAQRLDPLSPRINLDVGLPDYFEGRYEEAIAVARRVLELHPGFVPARIALRQACERKGLYREAALELRRTAEALGVDARPAGGVLSAAGAGGAPAYWRALLAQAEQGWPLPETAAHRANMWAALGDREQALAWLERALADRDDELVWIGVEPWYQPLRQDPRFTAIPEKVGLPRTAATP